MNAQWQVREIPEEAEWDALFENVLDPYLMQSSAYGKAIKAIKRRDIRYFVFEKSGEPAAACQVQIKRLAGFPIASRINQGPMFIDKTPSHEVKRNVMRLVRDHWRLLRKGPFKIQPGLSSNEENRQMLLSLGFKETKKSEDWWSTRIDLAAGEQKLRERLMPRWRNQLNAAYRNGLRLHSSNSLETAKWLIEKHKENMWSKGFENPTPEFAMALYRVAPHDFHVHQVMLREEPVAGACWFKYGVVAQLFIAWVGPKGREAKAENFLYWNAALEMKNLGCRWLDLGGLNSEHGFTRFKQGMGGREYKLCGDWLGY